MTRVRQSELWSKNANKPHPPSAGSPFGISHGLGQRLSCMRCGRRGLNSETVPDQRFKGQRRCSAGVGCGPAVEASA